jgi:hypothetical protein
MTRSRLAFKKVFYNKAKAAQNDTVERSATQL